MRVNGLIAVVAARNNIPNMLNVVVLQSLVVALGVCAYNAVVSCCRYEDEIGHCGGLELALLLE